LSLVMSFKSESFIYFLLDQVSKYKNIY